MNVFQVKMLAVLLLLVSGVAGGLAPLRVTLSERGRRRLALGNAFAGGIFLGAGLIHMLGDAIATFATIKAAAAYPWALLLAGVGFLAILALEKVGVKADESQVGRDSRALYPYVLLLVLSVHSVIAGTSLGLEGSMAAALAIVLALMAHKGAAAFALGVGLRQAEVAAPRHRRLVIFFACMTPLGVGLGTLFARLASSNAAAHGEGVFDALAAGSFLYVAIMDILAESYADPGDRLGKFLLATAGFALMAVIAIWT